MGDMSATTEGVDPKAAGAKDFGAQGSWRAWISIGVPVLALMLAIAATSIAVFVGFAHEQNREFVQSSRRLVANTIADRERAVAQLTLDYANWNDAYRAISLHWDGAWVSGNMYSNVVDGFVVFRADGAVRYAWFSDAYKDQRARLSVSLVHAAQTLPHLTALMRASTKSQTVEHAAIALDGQMPALIAVAPIAPEADSARLSSPANVQTDYLVSVQVLEPDEIANLGQSLGLQGFKFDPHELAASEPIVSVSLSGADGRAIGALRWRDDRPGDRAFAAQVTPFVLALLVFGILTVLIARYLVLRQIRSATRAQAAQESSRHKSEFISMMSHELRTPLNAIIGYAELILEEGAHQPQYQAVHDDAESIRVAARHLHQLFNEVLEQSRIDAGHLRLRRESVAVSELLGDIKHLCAPLALANGNTLTTRMEHPSMSLMGDQQRVRQCLLHLVNNALKFTKNGAVALNARYAVRDGAQWLTFDVTDTGIGIARDASVDLFEPFVQGVDIQNSHGGAGLGLSISRKLARAMGGDIVFESTLGRGSCFSLHLPVNGTANVHDLGDHLLAWRD